MNSRHLDIGCGAVPRNPYGRSETYGVDLVVPPGFEPARFRRANLTIEPIPYDDSSFDSVSAFDFLEHVPRLLPTADGRSTRFPFIELMDEIHRVLRPGGLLYALTPAFPYPEAFVDPTHVNQISFGTCKYFCNPEPLARMYGYRGAFELLRNEWAQFPEALTASPALGWRRRLRRWRKRQRGQVSHLIWELACVKPEA
jgi:SAM-dependent methyltransferase